MTPLSRRHFLIGGATLFLASCQQTTRTASLPDIHWPDVEGRPTPGNSSYVPKTAPAPAPTPRGPVAFGNIQLHPREEWASAVGPVRGRDIYLLGKPNRITIHHEGYKVVDFTDASSTMERLNMVRSAHVGSRGWSDIGYHFIVDRAGRVWEGRDLKYQGAHVSGNNEQNVGVMCLGNFEIQKPTTAQLNGLRETVRAIRQANNISERRIYTHKEITPTACPGRHLQPRVEQMRASHMFA